jgi:hypothetical protein
VGWPAQLGHGDRTIEGVKGRRRNAIEKLVAFDDSIPARFAKGRREAMLGGDARLRVVPRKRLALRGAAEPLKTTLDFLLVPERSVLLLEQQEAAAPVLSRRQPGAVQEHQWCSTRARTAATVTRPPFRPRF